MARDQAPRWAFFIALNASADRPLEPASDRTK